MAAPSAVEALLDAAARDVEENQRQANSEARASESRHDDRRSNRDRQSDRYYDRRDRDRDGDRYRERDRESNGDRRRSRDRDHRRRDGSRPRSSKDADTDEDRDSRYIRSSSRDRYRGRNDRRGGGDFYSGSGRARSRSPRRDREDRYRDRGRGDRGDRDERVDRDRSRDRRRGEERRSGGGSRRDRTPTPPEPTEDDRDKRTIFVQQISQRCEQRDLKKFFETIGEVVEAQIVKDRVTGRSKGVGYVEFKDEASVPMAIQQTGKKLKGIPIIAQLTEAEKNRASRPSEGAVAPGSNGAPFHRLYVGNIHFSVTENDLREIFEPFGELDQIILQRDELNPGRSKGYGFVQYVDPTNAKTALSEMNGFELAGRQIRVGLGNDKFTPESTANLLRTFNQQAQSYQGSAFSGAGGRGIHAGGAGSVFDRFQGKDDRGVSGASALDDTDVAGVNFKGYDRAKLMNALSRTEVQEPAKKGAAQPVLKQRSAVANTQMPSKCIKIENAFDADDEASKFGENWRKDLENEVKTECDTKYGKVVHIAVDANSDGDIYVKFDSVTGGEKAIQGLNGRSFNYRIIRASYVIDKIYNSLYGPAASKF